MLAGALALTCPRTVKEKHAVKPMLKPEILEFEHQIAGCVRLACAMKSLSSSLWSADAIMEHSNV